MTYVNLQCVMVIVTLHALVLFDVVDTPLLVRVAVHTATPLAIQDTVSRQHGRDPCKRLHRTRCTVQAARDIVLCLLKIHNVPCDTGHDMLCTGQEAPCQQWGLALSRDGGLDTRNT